MPNTYPASTLSPAQQAAQAYEALERKIAKVTRKNNNRVRVKLASNNPLYRLLWRTLEPRVETSRELSPKKLRRVEHLASLKLSLFTCLGSFQRDPSPRNREALEHALALAQEQLS